MERIQHFGDNYLNIRVICHPIQKLKSLFLQSLIFALKTVNNYKLMVLNELGILFINVP